MGESFELTGPLADRDSWTAAEWCSIEGALDLIGTRSAMTLLREAFYGATRFDDLVRRAGVTPAVGSQRLRQMVDNGLLDREPYQEPGQRTRHAYTITQLGLEIFPIITALAHLGDRLPSERDKRVLLTHAGCGQPITTEVRCTHGHAVKPSETVVSVVDSSTFATDPPADQKPPST
ncbi:winged helix-turn-helix transcriptional regulator [Catenulispora rubra]|uniref:winged helix-turn-helix transcriptional regulator n=1 Tax=Catenulispora rubra TaxID=280293 RepID=UPI0018927644|nr:helix-turn-helix domain-containing protein [Catenulispora rubra]